MRRDRLVRALADFDSATIATTHEFCLEVLGGLGVAGESDPGVTFVEDLSDLVDEVVDDLYVRRYMAGGEPRHHARAGARGRAGGGREPDGADRAARRRGRRPPAVRARLANRVRAELEERKRARCRS